MSQRITRITGWEGLISVWGWVPMGLTAGGVTGTLQIYRIILQKAGSGEQAIEGFEDLTDAQLIMEKVLFGLRMNEGIPWDLVPSAKQELIQTWIKDGFLLLENGNLKTTDRGRLVLDELSAD